MKESELTCKNKGCNNKFIAYCPDDIHPKKHWTECRGCIEKKLGENEKYLEERGISIGHWK
jgi:hypothetical protein